MSTKTERKRYVKIDPRHIKMPADISKGHIAEVHLSNISQDSVGFKFRMRDPSKCSVRPPKGVIPPSSEQTVTIHVMPAGASDRVDKLVIDTVPVVDVNNFDAAWKERKADVIKHSLAFKYEGEEAPATEPPSECPSGFVSVAQTPAAAAPPVTNVTVEPLASNLDSRLEDSTLYSSAAEIPEEQKAEQPAPAPAPAPTETAEFKELQEKYDKLLAERNELQTRVTALQGQIAKLQANAEAQQKKNDASSEEDRADRRSWIMFYAALIALVTVIIYSLVRPSSKKEL